MAPASNLAAHKAKRQVASLAHLTAIYEGVTVLDAMVFLKIAERPDIAPIEVASELGLEQVRTLKLIYGLEKGRSDNKAKAMGLVEIRIDDRPGFRGGRMLRLSPKGARVFKAMTEAS